MVEEFDIVDDYVRERIGKNKDVNCTVFLKIGSFSVVGFSWRVKGEYNF